MTNIEYWIKSSQDDLDTAKKLFNTKKYHHALFFAHLALEKILKAVYVNKKNEASPPIHDLIRLAEKSDLQLSEESRLQLVEISTFNVAARYDDYKFKFYKKATREYATKWMDISEKLINEFRRKI